MDLVTFLETNWFAIGGLIGLIGFVWKVNNNLNSYKHTIEDNNEKLEDKIEDMRKDITCEMKDMKRDVNQKFDDVYKQIATSEQARQEGSKRTLIIMNGVEATLRTLHDKGANGPVTKSLEELEQYKSEQAVK